MKKFQRLSDFGLYLRSKYLFQSKNYFKMLNEMAVVTKKCYFSKIPRFI